MTASISSNQSSYNISQGILTGAAVGTFAPLVVNPLEKWCSIIQTTKGHISYKELFKQPFKGVHLAIGYSSIKTIAIFGSLPFFRSYTDTYFQNSYYSTMIAGSCSGALVGYIMSPINTFKVQMYTQKSKSLREIAQRIPKDLFFKTLFSGSHTAACKYAIYWPTFLVSSDALSKIQLSSKTIQDIFSGSFAGMAAHTLTYPLDVVVKQQKTNFVGQNIVQVIHNLYKNEGIHAFFKGIAKAGIPRVLIAGALTQVIRSTVDECTDLFKNLTISNHS